MIKMLKCESLKLKNSVFLYVVLSIFLLQLLGVSLAMSFLANKNVLIDLAMLSFILYPLLASVSSLLLFEQERTANFFQELKCYPKKMLLWGTKLFLYDSLLGCALASSWLILGHLKLALSAILLSILLFHFHVCLTLFVGHSKNMLLGFIELILLIFASNKALLRVYLFPVVLPVNYIFVPKSQYLLSYLAYFLVVTVVLFFSFAHLKPNK